MSKHVDHFAAIPLRFIRAHDAGELDAKHVLVGALVAARCYDVRNTADGVAGIRLAWLAELCEFSEETVRTKLRELEERGWIGFDAPRPGQRVGWRIWLEGLAVAERDADPPPAEFQADGSSVGSSSSRASEPERAVTPHGATERTSRRAPDAELEQGDKRDETRRLEAKEENPRSEEKLDHVVDKTTAAESDRSTYRLIELATSGRARRVAVEQPDDGSLIWSREPQKGEQALLDDCQALVDGGLAEWVEQGDGEGS